MSKRKLLIFAISPLFLGYFINFLIMKLGWYGMSMMFLAILFAGYWTYGGYWAAECMDSRWEANLWGNGIIVLDFSFIAFQLVVLGRFLSNQAGFASQMFFLPILRISAMVRSLMFFLSTYDTLGIFILSLTIMIVLFNLGYSLRLKTR